MDNEAELERIRQFRATARQRIRRLDVLLDEQARILDLDPDLKAMAHGKQTKGHLITEVEIRLFAITLAIGALSAFLAGFWTARFH